MKRRAIKAIAVKDFKETIRDRADAFWIYGWPILIMLLTAYVFIPPQAGEPISLKVGLVDLDAAAWPEGVTYPVNASLIASVLDNATFKGGKLFKLTWLNSVEEAEDVVRGGKLDAVLIFEGGFAGNLSYAGTARVTLIVGGDLYKASISKEVLQGFLQGFASEITRRKVSIMVRYMEKYTPEEYRGYVKYAKEWLLSLAHPLNVTVVEALPKTYTTRGRIIGWFTFGAIGMVSLYAGFIGGAVAVVEEHEKRTLARIMASPISSWDLFLGKLLGNLLVLAPAALLCVLTGLLLGGELEWNPLIPEHWLAVALLLMVSVMCVGMGFILTIVSRAKSSKGASGLALILGLTLSFIAGVWLPKWMLAAPLRALAEVFPVTWTLDAVRSLLVYEATVEDVALDVAKSMAATVAIMALAALSYKLLVRRYYAA